MEVNSITADNSLWDNAQKGYLSIGGKGLIQIQILKNYNINNTTTVKPVYNDHLGDEVSAVVIGRWSL